MAKAAIAAGADGLMIEVHNNPEAALCDGAQSLKPEKIRCPSEAGQPDRYCNRKITVRSFINGINCKFRTGYLSYLY